MSVKNNKKRKTNCESCVNYTYDEDCDTYVCQVNLDEDEMLRFISSSYENCPYFRLYDEYSLSRKQASNVFD